MSKNKFTLTSDLVRVEPEPIQEHAAAPPIPQRPIKREEPKETINLKIKQSLKKELKMFCASNDISMTNVIEKALANFISDHRSKLSNLKEM